MQTVVSRFAVKQKPLAGTPLDQDHWAVAGLRYAFPFNEGGGAVAYNYGYQKSKTAVLTPASVFWKGEGLYFNGSTTAIADLGDDNEFQGELSFLVRARREDTGTGLRAFWGDNGSGGNERLISCYFENVAAVGLRCTVWSNLVKVISGVIPLVNGVWYTIGVTRSGAAGAWTYTSYVNGALDLTANTATNPNPTTDPMRIGFGGAFTGAPWLGHYDYFFCWNRALAFSEISCLTANPWQMFNQPSVRRWFMPPPVTSAPGTFNPGWATRATTIIGAGTV